MCRSPATREILGAYDRDDHEGFEAYRRAFDRSGIDPPDTRELAWGGMMSVDEALACEHVAARLEAAVREGRVVPGRRGWRAAQRAAGLVRRRGRRLVAAPAGRRAAAGVESAWRALARALVEREGWEGFVRETIRSRATAPRDGLRGLTPVAGTSFPSLRSLPCRCGRGRFPTTCLKSTTHPRGGQRGAGTRTVDG